MSSARDFSDSRTHENSDQGIHGLAVGDTLVGEDATQTLTNKTLATPTINSAELTGTIHANSTALVRLDNATNVTPTSTNHALQVGLTASGNLRMDNNEIMAVNNGVTSTLGLQQSGGNIAAYNSVAADSVANSVIINGVVAATQLQSTRPGATTTSYSARVTGDANSRLATLANGTLLWGGGSVAGDTNLFRETNNLLRTNDSLQVDTDLSVLGNAALNQLNVGTTATITGSLTVNGGFTGASASGATIGAVGAGWSLVSLTGYKVGGTTYITGVVNRTGATITPDTSSPNAGNITDTTLVTMVPAWRSNAGYNVTIACPCTDGVGVGGARLNTDGTLDLVSWTPNNIITSGGGANIRFSISFPSA